MNWRWGIVLSTLVACSDDVAGTGTGSTTATSTGASTSSDSTATSAHTSTSGGGPGDMTSTSAPTTSATSSASTTGSVDSTTGDTSSSTGVEPCPEGAVICEGDTVKVCDGMGGTKFEEACAKGCLDGYGCQLCVPNTTACSGQTVYQCNDDGTQQTEVEDCDPFQGMECDPDIGKCVGECVADALGRSNVGCDFYLNTSLQHDLHNDDPDATGYVVANVSDEMVVLTLSWPNGQAKAMIGLLGPTEVSNFSLGWVDALSKGAGPTARVEEAAVRLRATSPVAVYQFNTSAPTGSSDASMLLPVSAWSDRYLVASWASSEEMPGFYTVTAAHDDTTITLAPSATGKAVQAGAGVAADGSGVVTLDAGEALQVVAQLDAAADLTGTLVTADKPVQVIGGHKCANIPADIASCDHLEEAMLPLEGLATNYLVVPPMDAVDKARIVRIVASEDDTALTFSPDQPVAKKLPKAGEFLELGPTTAAFLVSADKKILVSQYMLGQPNGDGDPSMLLVISPEHWRKYHVVHALTGWPAQFADLVAKDGAHVTFDGLPVGGWQPIAGTGYSITHVEITDVVPPGNHVIACDEGVGVAVRGVADLASYWYPAGYQVPGPSQ